VSTRVKKVTKIYAEKIESKYSVNSRQILYQIKCKTRL